MMVSPDPDSKTPRRILITGSRDWVDEKAIDDALRAAFYEYGVATLVSGGCPTGADAIAERIWEAHAFPVERHPADWDAHGKAAGPRRNQEMVDLGADICIAFPLPDSRGTVDCAKKAKAAGIRVHPVGPHADILRELGDDR